MARAQCHTHKAFIENSKLVNDHLPPHRNKKHISITIDMGQNITYPNLAGEQAGDTYYLSCINAFDFGIVNNVTELMGLFIWNEDEGKRGADNITSCLHHYFTKLGVFQNKYKEGNQKENR